MNKKTEWSLSLFYFFFIIRLARHNRSQHVDAGQQHIPPVRFTTVKKLQPAHNSMTQLIQSKNRKISLTPTTKQQMEATAEL